MDTILFACVKNSFRSQIAEAYFNRFASKGWKALNTGLKPTREIHPNTVKLMLEESINIRNNKYKLLVKDLQDVNIAYSGSICPVIYAKHVEEWSILDPAITFLNDTGRIGDEIKIRFQSK